MISSLLLLTYLFQADPTYVVSGTVVNRLDNRPLSNARVSLGAPNAEPIVTGKDGRFRFEGLKAGKYRLTAERSGYARQSFRQRSLLTNLSTAIVTGEQQNTEDLVFGMIPSAAISGTVTDSRGNVVPGMRVLAYPVFGLGENRRVGDNFYYAVTDDRGEYRLPGLSGGNYALVFAGWTSLGIPSSATPTGYPVSYYPGTTEPGAAGVLRVEPGKEIRADALLNPVLVGQVNGQVLLPNLPEKTWVTVSVPGVFGNEIAVVKIQIAGASFFARSLPAGRYYFDLQDDEGRPLGRTTANIESGEAMVSIGETRFARIFEKVEVRGAQQNSTRPVVVRLYRLGMQGVRNMDADGRAMIPSLPPGQYEVTVTQGSALAILSMSAQGASVSGSRVTVPETGDVNLTILADASAAQSINGYAVRGDKPEGGLLAALVPAKDWQNTSQYRFDQSDSDGSFLWRAVAPGDYIMFAFEDGAPADYTDSKVISGLASKGQRITITGDPKQTVTVRLTPR